MHFGLAAGAAVDIGDLLEPMQTLATEDPLSNLPSLSRNVLPNIAYARSAQLRGGQTPVHLAAQQLHSGSQRHWLAP